MDKNVEKKLTQNIDALTDGGKAAIVLCANSFRFGGNWGFIRREKHDFKEQLETLKEERKSIKAIPVSNGALVLADENFLAHNVNLAVPGAINGNFVDMANKRRREEQERFAKFIQNVAVGKSSHVKSKDGYYELTLGLFCVNDTNAIRLNGHEYPAYKLNMIEALDYAVKALASSGKKLYAKAITDEGKQVSGLVVELAMNSKGVQALYRGLEIADSDTGVFLSLAIL